MATTTPNFGWPVPTSTDLVKDGATAIEGLGDAIDASLLDLKGGTSGQVLAKASNTDMDFSWVTDATGIPATIFDAKGDIVAATAADTASRLAVGANGTVLTADSTTATGLKWDTPAGGGGKVLQVVNATTSTEASTGTTTFVDTGLTATITPTLSTSKILVLVNQNGCRKDSSDTSLILQLLRGATVLTKIVDFGGSTDSSATNTFNGASSSYLDSPATTSAITYKTQFASKANTNRVLVQTATSTSTITLLEIGA